MPAQGGTTIHISRLTWVGLNRLKEHPRESFDDVLRRLLMAHHPEALPGQLQMPKPEGESR